MNVLVLHSQVPYVSGGAELLVNGLASAISDRGHEVDIVALPLSWDPPERLLTTALAWRLLDLSRFNDKVVDRVVCTKYPTWAADHNHKSLWLVHQHRQAYDLHGTRFSEFGTSRDAGEIRRRLVEIDRVGIRSCDKRYAISRNVSERLRCYSGIEAAPLYPPTPRSGLHADAYEPFVLSVARLDAAKRVDRVIAALEHVAAPMSLHVVGDGPDRGKLERLARRHKVSDRVVFHGRVSDASLRTLYNRCRAVYYAPLDEDYGYTAVEALTAGKPVITAPDSGGVLEFVRDGVTGIVSELAPRALASAIDRLANEGIARKMGAAGPRMTAGLTWNTVVDALIGG